MGVSNDQQPVESSQEGSETGGEWERVGEFDGLARVEDFGYALLAIGPIVSAVCTVVGEFLNPPIRDRSNWP